MIKFEAIKDYVELSGKDENCSYYDVLPGFLIENRGGNETSPLGVEGGIVTCICDTNDGERPIHEGEVLTVYKKEKIAVFYATK